LKKSKFKISALAITLIFSILLTTMSAVSSARILQAATSTNDTKSIYAKTDISQITREGGNPPEFTSNASTLAKEKEWYEYVNYSVEPVGIYNLNDISRIAFFDPYDYSGSLVMEIDDTVTDWSSANSLTATYETGNTMTTGMESSTQTNSSIEVAQGEDVSGSTSSDYSKGISTSRSDTYNKSKTSETTDTTSHTYQWGLHEDVGGTIPIIGGISVGGGSEQNWTDTTEKATTTGVTEDTGWNKNVTTDEVNHIGTTTAWTKVADRVSSATGSSNSNSQSWSTSNSTTISKTYNASYFNASGSPLQWKIVKYTVTMPMYYKVQYLVDDIWITSESAYCLLTTIQGTCRSWIQNNTAYYEHWGTGEPVTWNEFWGKFFTKESLVAAYKNKLYPNK